MCTESDAPRAAIRAGTISYLYTSASSAGGRGGRRKNNAVSKAENNALGGKSNGRHVQRERVWRRTRRWPSWRRSCPPARPVSALSRPELSEHGRVPPRRPTPLPSCPPCPPGRGCAGPGSWRPSRQLFRRLHQRHQTDIRVRKKSELEKIRRRNKTKAVLHSQRSSLSRD